MALVTWDASYCVNVKRCDAEHRKLFGLINALHEAISAGKGKAIIASVVGEMEKYTRSHFSTEEALMERAKYPALNDHRAEHLKFVAQVEQFKKDLAAGTDPMAVQAYLQDWLTQHVKQIDTMYSEFLNSHGID